MRPVAVEGWTGKGLDGMVGSVTKENKRGTSRKHVEPHLEGVGMRCGDVPAHFNTGRQRAC